MGRDLRFDEGRFHVQVELGLRRRRKCEFCVSWWSTVIQSPPTAFHLSSYASMALPRLWGVAQCSHRASPTACEQKAAAGASGGAALVIRGPLRGDQLPTPK